MSLFALEKKGEDVPPGRYVVDVNEGLPKGMHQVSLSGTGTVTVSVYVPGEVDRNGAPDEVIVGELPIQDQTFDLSVPQPPLVLQGFIDAFVFEATGTFSYRIHSA